MGCDGSCGCVGVNGYMIRNECDDFGRCGRDRSVVVNSL